MPPAPRTLLSPTFPSPHLPKLPTLSLRKRTHCLPNKITYLRFPSPSHQPIRCSVSLAEASSPPREMLLARPSPAEVSRTIMELSSTGTLSTLTPDGWPLGIGARFVVDAQGLPVLCLNVPGGRFSMNGRSSFHVQLEQSGLRTPQCTLLGSFSKPEDGLLLKKLCATWEKKFGEGLDKELAYVVSVERVLQMEDFKEDGTWVTSLEYVNANPDPLRNCAQKIVDEMNARHSEDVQRICNVYVDTEFQATNTKMIWVDRLGFDLLLCAQREVFEARIPFHREVTDEKGVKSSFNCMSHLAWEVEKNYAPHDFEKVKSLKKIR